MKCSYQDQFNLTYCNSIQKSSLKTILNTKLCMYDRVCKIIRSLEFWNIRSAMLCDFLIQKSFVIFVAAWYVCFDWKGLNFNRIGISGHYFQTYIAADRFGSQINKIEILQNIVKYICTYRGYFWFLITLID